MFDFNVRSTSLVLFSIVLLTALLTAPVLASWDQGVAAFKAGQFQDAAQAFEAVTAKQPALPQAHYMLGMSLVRQGQNKAALTPLRRALELDANKSDVRLLLAHAELHAGQADRAVQTLTTQSVEDLDSKNRKKYIQLLGKSALESGKDRQAHAALVEATSAINSPALWLARGTVAKRLDNHRDAFESFQKARKSDPTNATTPLRAISSALALGDAASENPAQRASWYGRAAEVAATLDGDALDDTARALTSSAFLLAGNITKARVGFTALSQKTPKDPRYLYNLASCDLAEMKGGDALARLDKALPQVNDETLRANVHTARGKALRQLERFDDAAQAFALAGNQDAVAEMNRLAAAKINNDEWEEARRQCVDRQAKADQIRKDGEVLKGTPAWAELEQEIESLMAGCADFLSPITS